MYGHDNYHLTGTLCILCEMTVPSSADSYLILSGPEGPVLPGTTTSHDQGSALHKGCLETLRNIFQRRKKFDLTQRLWLFERIKSLSWPLRMSTRHIWVKQFAGRSFNELVRTSGVLTELGYNMKRLPEEILEHVGEYCHPSSLTGFAILRQSALFINVCEVDENQSRIISIPDGRLFVSFRGLFQHTYVANVMPVEARPDSSTDFLLCTDGVACRDIKRADNIRRRDDRWYRHVRATCGDKLLLVYEVIKSEPGKTLTSLTIIRVSAFETFLTFGFTKNPTCTIKRNHQLCSRNIASVSLQ